MVAKKSIKAYPKSVRGVFELLSWHNDEDTPEVMGSASNPNIKNASDYDLYEVVLQKKNTTLDSFLKQCHKMFRKLCLRIKRDKAVYFIDFKCGELNGEPVRWTLNEVIKGTKPDTNKNFAIKFVDCLEQKSRIKVDVIAYVGGQFTEFSNIFSLQQGKKKINEEDETTAEIQTHIKEDIKEFKADGNLMKALKRQYLLHRSPEYEEFFNSDTGTMSKAVSDINTMIELLHHYNNADIRSKVAEQLDGIRLKLQLPQSVLTKFDNAVDGKTKKQLISRMTRIVKELTKIVNKDVKSWMARNRITFEV